VTVKAPIVRARDRQGSPLARRRRGGGSRGRPRRAEESAELSRRFRALKLWLSLRYHGIGQFRAAIRKDLEHAQLLARLITAEPTLELLAPVVLSTVCFRWKDAPEQELDQRNAAILHEVNRRGRVCLSNASIHGAFALRACILNHRTTDADVTSIVEEVAAAAAAA